MSLFILSGTITYRNVLSEILTHTHILTHCKATLTWWWYNHQYSVVCSIRTPQSQSMTLLLLHNKTPPLWTRTPHTLSRTPLPHNRTLLPHNRTPHTPSRTPLPHNRTALIRTLLPHNRTALIRTLLPHNRMCWTLVRSDLLLVLEDREDYLYRYTL